MTECPQHRQQALNLICLTQQCPNRGAICQQCSTNHRAHNIQQLGDYLNDQQRLLMMMDQNDIDEEQQLQSKVLMQLDQLKREIANVIARLQIESQQNFQEEIQVRNAQASDQQRQLDLIKTVQTQRVNAQMLKEKVLELLHRQQAKYPPSRLHRYQEVSRRIEISGKDIVQTLQALLDVHERQLSISDDSSSIKAPSKPQLVLAAPKFSNSPSPPQLFTQNTQFSEQRQFTETRPFPSSSRSKSPIFSTPRRDDQAPQMSSNSSRRQLEQRDLDPVGTYSSVMQTGGGVSPQPAKSDKYFSQIDPRRSEPKSQKSITMPSMEQSQTIEQYPQVQRKPESDMSANNIQSKSAIQFSPLPSNIEGQEALHSQIRDQHARINKHHLTLEGQKNNFNSRQIPSQDLNASYISSRLLKYNQTRSVTPPPVRVTQGLKSIFEESLLINWRAHDKGVKDIALMDSDKLITCSGDNTIKIWDKAKAVLKLALEGHEKPVLCIAFHPKRIIASGSADRSIKIWRPAPTWQLVNNLQGHHDRVRCVCFISSSLIASGSDDCTVRIWDLEQGGVCAFTLAMEEADATSGRVSRLAFYAGSLVAAASKNLHLWDANTYKQIKSQPAHDNLIISMTLQTSSTQKALLVTGSKDLSIKLWELPSLVMLIRIKEDYPPQTLDIDPSSSYLVVGLLGFEGEGKICVWSLKNGVVKIHETVSNPSGCNAVLFDRLSNADRMIIYSAHENKKIEINALTTDQ